MRLLGSDLHRPINNSDGRPLGLPSDSGPAHKYRKTGCTHTGGPGGNTGTVPETGLKTVVDRSMGNHGKITLFGKESKKGVISGGNGPKIDSQPGNRGR